MNQEIVDFLIAQGVQDVISDIDLSWMHLGHIDEVISFATTPDGRARVASPEAAWALLLIAKRDGHGNDVILKGMNGNNNLNTGLTVNEVLSRTVVYNGNFNPAGGYSEKLIANVRDRLGLEPTVSEITAINGAPVNTLLRVGYLECYAPDGVEAEWQVIFDPNGSGDFEVFFRGKGNVNWISDGVGNRNEDFVSISKLCYILKVWWGNSTIAPGQGYTFTTHPSSNMIEMPVLFYRDYWDHNGAVAFTNNVINSLVDGDTLFVADVNNLGIFNWYVDQVAWRVGFTNVIFCEERMYHNGIGSIHCGTNVLRKIPLLGSNEEWWKVV